jgi:peroxiredoxin 2/4
MQQPMIGKPAPQFEMPAVLPNGSFSKVSLQQILNEGKWTVLLFYPMDFTSICPTEITALSDRYEEFEELETKIIGISTDSVYTHLAWINTDRLQNGVGHLKFPLAADRNGSVSKAYGVLVEDEGIALRGLFIINPHGELQYQTVFNKNVGRDVDETLRVLQALQTGGLCPANWRPGQKTM